MASVLEELGALHLTRPGRSASDAEVAAWQERRALMLEHAAALRELNTELAETWAAAAHERAARLLSRAQARGLPGGDFARDNARRPGPPNPHHTNRGETW